MAEHELNKIVDDDGEVFNLRDSTKQPVADRVTSIRAASSATDTNYPTEKAVRTELEKKVPIYNEGSEVPSSQDLVCLRIKCPYVSGVYKSQVLLYDITSFADGTIVNNDGAYVTFKGFLIGGEPTGSGDAICVKICAKVAYTQISGSASFRTLKSDSSICGPEIIKRTEDGVDKYYLSIFYESTLFQGNDVLVGSFRWRAPNGISDYSYKNGVIGEYRPNQTYPANEPFWDRLISFTSNVAANTADKLSSSRKLKTNLARTSDSTFDGSADQTNIPVTGTLGVGNGGTGRASVTSGNYVVGAGTSAMVEKTPKEVGSNVLSSLDDKSNASSYANFVDGDFVVGSDHVDASTISASTFVRRTALNLWNYIKGKLTGSDVNIGGNAATATNATTAGTAKAYDTSFSGTNSIASMFVEKQNRIAWDANADTYNASTNRAATVDSIVKRIAVKPDGFSASVDYTNAVELSIPYSAGPGRVALMCVATTGNGDTASFQATFVKNANEKLKFVVGTIMASTGTFVSPVLKFLSSDDSSPAQKVVLYIDASVRCNLSCLVAANDGMSSITVTEVARSTADNYSSLQSWGRLANDSGVVHIDGTETIIGAKEFSRSGQDTNFTDSSGAESIVRARTSSNSNYGSAQIDAYAGGGKFGVYARNASGTGKWVACLDNDGVVNLGSSGDAVRIGGTKFVFGASQLGTDSNTFYWV